MKDQPTQFQQLIQEVQQGSHEAARHLAETYGPHVQRYVRRTLTRDLRHQYDSLDFVQLVWASFFCDVERVPTIDTPAQLVAYLGRMAQYKVLDESRKLQTQKCDVQREERLDQPDSSTMPVFGREPTPSAVAIFREEWDNLVTNQPEDVGRVAQLRYEGATIREIADELNIHERTVRKKLDRLQRDRAGGDEAQEK